MCEEIHVRTLLLGTVMVVAIAGAPTMVTAQDANPNRSAAAQMDDGDDGGEWGWLGLLGLAGLMGLKRRDRVEEVTRNRATVQ
jgi:MYXO-CTERM domain-containing protein